MQQILQYEYWWDGYHNFSKKFDSFGHGILYPYYESSNPCLKYSIDNNAAIMEDEPGLHYNWLQARTFGHPRFLHVHGITCAVCTNGPEAYETESIWYGEPDFDHGPPVRHEVHLNSLSIYGCMEWEFTLQGSGYPSPGKAAFTKSMKVVPCQHAIFLGLVHSRNY